MAKTVVALEATINSSGAESSVKSLRAQLKEAQADVAAMAEKFGDTSTQAAEAAKRAANLKDKIGDAKALTDAFSPDKKFQAFSSALSGVAGGFSAVQGAMGLFGAESKDLEKTLLKVQSAMALSQGLSAITESADAFKNLKTVAVDAFNGIKAAIGSTGIGLLVIALGAIYAYWDDIKGAVSGVSAEQEKLNKKTQENLDAEKEKLKSVGDQDNILKLQGKSEKEILKLKINQIDAVIKATEASIVQAKIIKNAQIEAEKRNYEILRNITRFGIESGVAVIRAISAPFDLMIKGVNSLSDTLGFGKVTAFSINEEITKLSKFGSETVSKLIFDPEKTAKEGDKTIKEQENALTKLKNDRAGFQLQIQGIDKAASDKAKAEKEKSDKEAEEKEKQRLENLTAQNKATDELILKNRIQSIKDEFQRKQFEIAVNQQKEIDAQIELLNKGLITQKEYNQRKLLIEENYQKQQNDLLDKHNQDQLKKLADADLKKINDTELSFEQRRQAIADREALINSITFENEAARTEFQKQNADARKKIDEEEANNKIAQAQRGAALLSNISELVGKETAAGKATAIAAATIDTYQAAWAAFKNAQKNPISILGPVYPYLQAGLAVAGGIANIKKIMAVQVPGGGGGGGSVSSGGMNVPSAPVAPQTATTTINQGQVNQLASATARAFVLESDVSGNQERIQRLNRAARIS